eukprot:GDKI01021414.1.p2 GENE.GDKI01021414.1~~GDKI01021414.1.p2  ORF type:complete len:101 (-),score=29.02 GDKI01021414.1:119-382(-)
MASGNFTDEQKAQALMGLQTIIEGQEQSMKLLGKCFDKCVEQPGNELSKTQQQCIWNCTHSMFETETFLAKRLEGLSKAQGAGHDHH